MTKNTSFDYRVAADSTLHAISALTGRTTPYLSRREMHQLQQTCVCLCSTLLTLLNAWEEAEAAEEAAKTEKAGETAPSCQLVTRDEEDPISALY